MKLSIEKNKLTTTDKRLVVVSGILVVIILFGSGGWLYFSSQIYSPKDPQAESQEFVVAQGESVRQIASNLEAEGIIKDSFLFLIYWKLGSDNTDKHRFPQIDISGYLGSSASSVSVKAGRYSLSPSMPIPVIVSKLTQGKTNVVEVTIPEGFNTYEIDKRLNEKDVITQGELVELAREHSVDLVCEDESDFRNCSLNLRQSVSNQSPISASSVSSLEGWLFPDTYKFKKGVSAEVTVKKMLSNFEKKPLPFISEFTPWPVGRAELNEVDGSELSVRSSGADVYRCKSVGCILTVASMVEKEVQSFEKKRLVAGVIFNRLERGMKLDSCPTVIYAQTLAATDPYEFIETRREHNPISLMDTEIDSEYNTYQNNGLPPSPISNPGLDSIKAVLNPVETDYLFYLSNPAGQTKFSETYQEHLRKKNRFLD